ncbi:efflux transporter outer membrane subunit [Verrucomicrobiaceae bacterium 5K15]|uniref:Efflux transporter outer membrane subunit n=1 Tax=Oceaniferula flava TaxID=2800421 RepID=A0AAE2SA41_9BACT|nr:efflux transporter outer membrane subunit [Oceaniferula flavus]MBK1854583.1 efflux transporter outer membrane subunit [Oceaniferula flavus]MBM1135889.1 efflux transporter outer membrane subunit [Oceaniferula flavus]
MIRHALIRTRLTLPTLAVLSLASSCVPIGDPSDQPQIEVPKAWAATTGGTSGKISRGWVKDLNDSRLPKLVNEAMTNNPSILATADRLKAARASVIRARANRLPSLSASSGASRSRTNSDANGGATSYSSSTSISVGASWEFDLWGRLRHLHTAATADYDSTVADLRSARLSLAANVASTWYNLISAENQVKLARETLASYQQVEKIIVRNYKAGTARSLELQLSRNNVFSAERILRSRLSNRDDARRNLEVLLGRYPLAKIQSPSDLPNIPQSVPSGLPSGLIARRPDIVAARLDLLSSFHRAEAAKKDLLPSLRLTGSSGTSSSSYGNLLDPGYLSSSISSSISQSLFDAGANREDARATVARNSAAIHDYSDTVLDAYREVESALASESWLKQQEQFLRKELEQAALAERQAERDYAEGVDGVDILDLLETQRRASTARSSLIDLQNQRIQNRINLYLALGGDFTTQPSSTK